MNKSKYFIPALALGLLSSCADDLTKGYVVEQPLSLQVQEELNSLDPLKSYKTAPNLSPNFKLGGALTATDFVKGGNIGALAVANFDEIVAGNAMKYSSCVDDKGVMNFTTVEDFVKAAEKASIGIYGHTLAWHSQQRPKYLTSLLKDKEPIIEASDDNEVKTIEDFSIDYSTMSKYEMWHGGDLGEDGHIRISSETDGDIDYQIQATDGVLKITNYVVANASTWRVQYFVADGLTLKGGQKYTLTFEVKCDEETDINGFIGPWGKHADFKLPVTKEWEKKSVVVTTNEEAEGTFHIGFQSGHILGDLCFKNLVVTHEEVSAGIIKSWEETLVNGDLTGDDFETSFGASGYTGELVTTIDGEKVLQVSSPGTEADDWRCQLFIASTKKFNPDDKIRISIDVKADKASNSSCSTQAQSAKGDYNYWSFAGGIDFTTEWKTWTKTLDVTERMCAKGEDGKEDYHVVYLGAMAINLGKQGQENTFYFKNLKWEVETEILPEGTEPIPLTEEEKKDTLTWALGNWIEGMMEATNGYVKAWDVVNEPIAGNGDDGEGFYTLQHGTANDDGIGGNSDVFFWQDYLGDLDYVRTAVSLARKHFKGDASDLKLFVNDYNLESDWDDNHKLKSLIHWVEKWEADGVTKIDGLGTQMHISCYEDETTQESKKEHIAKMFELMAATGKLIRVSELDMGYVTKDGTSLQTEELTEAQHQQMADLYKYVVKTYLEKVPAAQQYGICQWCLTDSPKSSSWRKGQPTGLWTEKFIRKVTFKGFAEGLSGK
jgi:GH35 family endo-1,4-beta-xylanase